MAVEVSVTPWFDPSYRPWYVAANAKLDPDEELQGLGESWGVGTIAELTMLGPDRYPDPRIAIASADHPWAIKKAEVIFNQPVLSPFMAAGSEVIIDPFLTEEAGPDRGEAREIIENLAHIAFSNKEQSAHLVVVVPPSIVNILFRGKKRESNDPLASWRLTI